MDILLLHVLYLTDANLKYNYVNDTKTLLSENLWIQQTLSDKNTSKLMKYVESFNFAKTEKIL